jgi:vacuolar protein 8
VLALVKLAKEGAEKMKARAATALMTLADDDENKVTIAKAGGIQVLIGLARGANVEAAEQAAGALLILAYHEPNQELMSKTDGALAFLHLVKEGSVVAKERAAGLLTVIANMDDNMVTIAEADGVAALVALITPAQEKGGEKAGTNETATHERATALLMQLALDERNDRAMVDAGAAVALVQMLRSGSATAKELAAAALLNMAEAGDEVRGTIAKAGGVEALLRLLLQGRGASKEQAIAALVALATSAVVRAEMVVMFTSAVSTAQTYEIQQADARANGSGETEDMADAYMSGVVKLLDEGKTTAGGSMEQAAALLCLLSRSAIDGSGEDSSGRGRGGGGRGAGSDEWCGGGGNFSAAFMRAGGVAGLVGAIGRGAGRGAQQQQGDGPGQGNDRGRLVGGDSVVASDAVVHTEACVAHACGALFSMSASNSAMREEIRRAGGVEVLVAVAKGRRAGGTKGHSGDRGGEDRAGVGEKNGKAGGAGAAAESALAAALSLAPGVIKKPAVQPPVQPLKGGGTERDTERALPVITVAREQATGALANMCTGGAESKAAVEAAGGVEVLLQVAREAGEVEQASRAEGGGRRDGAGRGSAGSPGAAGLAAEVCFVTVAVAKSNAVGGLCNLASAESCALRMVGSAGTMELLIDLARCGESGGRNSFGVGGRGAAGTTAEGGVDADVATAEADGDVAAAVEAAAKMAAEDAKGALGHLAAGSTKHRLEIQRLGGGMFLGNMVV